MQALLLAAGRSERFAPLGDKNFLTLGSQTLLERQVALLRGAGVKKIIIAAGHHNAEAIGRLLPKAQIVIQAKASDGMAGAVLAAAKLLTEPTVIVSTNDLYGKATVKKLLTAKNCAGAILAERVKAYFPGGYLTVRDGRVQGIVEKPGAGHEPSDLINLVCHYYKEPQKLTKILQKIPKQGDDRYEKALGKLCQTEKILAVPNPDPWQALKYPWHLLKAMQLYLAEQKKPRKAAGVEIAKTAVIRGPVVIEKGVRILDYAVVVGPAYLGAGSLVGTGSLVRESHIGAGSIVGGGSEVARSYLGRNVWLHRNYVGDSVLADNVALGSGTVTGNLRLDEGTINSYIKGEPQNTGLTKLGAIIGANVRIGINVSLMPGTVIGNNTMIGGGLPLGGIVTENSFITADVKLKVRKNKQEVLWRKA